MVERVRSNQTGTFKIILDNSHTVLTLLVTGLQNKKFRVEQMKEAFTDVQVWCYCLIAFCTTLPTSGLGAFANVSRSIKRAIALTYPPRNGAHS